MGAPYPWQSKQWQSLIQRQRQQALPHALLLQGPTGMGKGAFALQLAQAVLCAAPNESGAPCGQCDSCRQFLAEAHPDFHLTASLEAGKIIGVDQVRQLGGFLALTSHYGRGRVVIINPAEKMNNNAANSLLKTLEEPPAGTLLLLVSAHPARLLATIRSRCQQVDFPIAEQAAMLQWLQTQKVEQAALLLSLAGGAPLKAQALAEGAALEQRQQILKQLEGCLLREDDVSKVAKAWSDLGLESVLFWLRSWFMDMVRIKSTNIDVDYLANGDIGERLQPLAERLNWQQLYGSLDRFTEVSRPTQMSLNVQMFFEGLLIGWKR